MIAAPDQKVYEALQQFYGLEKLGQEAFEDGINYFQWGFVRIPYPNLSARRRLIYLHDINHILTGYDTSWMGESEVAAWELASGFPRHCWVGYLYSPFALVPGIFLNLPRVCRAFKKGLRAKNSCHFPFSREKILDMRVVDLRNCLTAS